MRNYTRPIRDPQQWMRHIQPTHYWVIARYEFFMISQQPITLQQLRNLFPLYPSIKLNAASRARLDALRYPMRKMQPRSTSKWAVPRSGTVQNLVSGALTPQIQVFIIQPSRNHRIAKIYFSLRSSGQWPCWGAGHSYVDPRCVILHSFAQVQVQTKRRECYQDSQY
jgi:hypothetical protein